MIVGRKKTIMLLVTSSCNLRCSYCYEPKLLVRRMDTRTAKDIITRQMALLDEAYDSVEIQFMGGEPMLEFPLIKEVSEWLWSKEWNRQTVVFVPTNGTLLDSEMKSWFAAHSESIKLGLSFDGDAGMQNANRFMSYDSVDLGFFVTTWPEQSVKMTLAPETIANMAAGVMHLHEKGFKYISADLAMGPNIQWTKQSLKAYQSGLRELADYYLSHPSLVPFSMRRINVASVLAKADTHLKTCSCGEDLLSFDWTGATYACHLFSPIALSLDKAKRGNERYDFADHSQFESPTCSRCMLNSVCNHCYGMNYLCSDDVTKPSPFHCSAFKIQFAENCRFQMHFALNDHDNDTYETLKRVIRKMYHSK